MNAAYAPNRDWWRPTVVLPWQVTYIVSLGLSLAALAVLATTHS